MRQREKREIKKGCPERDRLEGGRHGKWPHMHTTSSERVVHLTGHEMDVSETHFRSCFKYETVGHLMTNTAATKKVQAAVGEQRGAQPVRQTPTCPPNGANTGVSIDRMCSRLQEAPRELPMYRRWVRPS